MIDGLLSDIYLIPFAYRRFFLHPFEHLPMEHLLATKEALYFLYPIQAYLGQ